jgi:hypothetical protein
MANWVQMLVGHKYRICVQRRTVESCGKDDICIWTKGGCKNKHLTFRKAVPGGDGRRSAAEKDDDHHERLRTEAMPGGLIDDAINAAKQTIYRSERNARSFVVSNNPSRAKAEIHRRRKAEDQVNQLEELKRINSLVKHQQKQIGRKQAENDKQLEYIRQRIEESKSRNQEVSSALARNIF